MELDGRVARPHTNSPIFSLRGDFDYVAIQGFLNVVF
jgi:hypothetical protein